MILTHWRAQRIDEMAATDLRQALRDLWQSYCCVNAEKMGTNDLPFIADDGGKAYAQLGEWWYGPDAAEPNGATTQSEG